MPTVTVPTGFDPLSGTETALHAALEHIDQSAGRVVDIDASAHGKTVRSTFLRWLLIEALPGLQLPVPHLKLSHAVIKGELDLSGTTIATSLILVECTFQNELKLHDASLAGFAMEAGRATDILADRVKVGGSLLLRAARGQIKGPEISRLHLNGAEIHGNLDMRGCTLGSATSVDQKRPPLFADGVKVHGNAMLSYGFRCFGELRLNGADITRNLDCSGAQFRNPDGFTLSAAGAHVAGSLYLCRTKPWSTYPTLMPFASYGLVRLDGAKIDGDLDCNGGTFVAAAFPSHMPHDCRSTAAKPDYYAIRALGLETGSDIRLSRDDASRDPFNVHGVASFINVQVGGDLLCSYGIFDFAGEEPFEADGSIIAGRTYFDHIQANGILRFVQCDFKGGLFLNKAQFDTTAECRHLIDEEYTSQARLEGPACGIFAPLASVEGSFIWQGVTRKPDERQQRNRLWLYIPGSKANVIRDDEQSWKALDRFDVTGCQYDTILDLSAKQTKWRIAMLDSQYAILNRPHLRRLTIALERLARSNTIQKAMQRFQPLPYIQLANTYRSAGYESSATTVLVAMEKNRTRYSDMRFRQRLWRVLLRVCLRYGYSPFRPVLILIVWAIVSAAVFQCAYDAELLIPSKDNPSVPVPPPATARPRIEFNSIVYAVDTLVPIVDLSQRKNWVFKSLRTEPADTPSGQQHGWREALQKVWQTLPDNPSALLLVFNTFFGWMMTTLFAAGVSGLLRAGK